MEKMKIVNYVIYANLSRDYKIALLADLHGKFNANIIPALSACKPDMICIAGDLINTSLSATPEVKSFLTSCVRIACTYFSLGNHDFLISKADIEQIKSLGVHVLNDEFESFNSEIDVGGMTSYFYHKCEKYDPKIPMALYPEVKWLDAFEQRKEYKILLDHHPDNYEKYTRNREIDLILSGHCHGGQIRLFGKGLYGKSQGLFPKYDGGVFDNKLIVSRGLTNTAMIPRLWNAIETVIIELKRG